MEFGFRIDRVQRMKREMTSMTSDTFINPRYDERLNEPEPERMSSIPEPQINYSISISDQENLNKKENATKENEEGEKFDNNLDPNRILERCVNFSSEPNEDIEEEGSVDVKKGESITAHDKGDNADDDLASQLVQEAETHPNRHEIELCHALTNAYVRCSKNPGHINFIPVIEFGLGHLPAMFRDKGLVNYIKALSRFIVRLEVTHTSVERPSNFPCANIRGTDRKRYATGFAWVPGDVHTKDCPLSPCPHERQSHSIYGPIRILTNKHVVYDQTEADQTKAQFFFDNPCERQKLPLAKFASVEYSSKESDLTHLMCYTHSKSLCDTLLEEMGTLTNIYKTIPLSVWEATDAFTVIISHPHGTAKSISVGSYHRFKNNLSTTHIHYYSSATCPGSSGAPVFYVNKMDKGAHPMWIPAVHSHYSKSLGLNCGFK